MTTTHDYTLAQLRHATDVADGEVPVLSARRATRREIAGELRRWYPHVHVSRAALTRALDLAERRRWHGEGLEADDARVREHRASTYHGAWARRGTE